MPRTKGTKQLFAEVTDTLLDGFKAFCELRKETVRENLEMAMRRHMANPPPPPTPVQPPPLVPLPPIAHYTADQWTFTERRAYYNGKPTAIKPTRHKLLRVFLEADGLYSAKDLAKLAFDDRTDEENIRYHIRELRKELQDALGITSNPIPGDGGYRLDLEPSARTGDSL